MTLRRVVTKGQHPIVKKREPIAEMTARRLTASSPSYRPRKELRLAIHDRAKLNDAGKERCRFTYDEVNGVVPRNVDS